MAGSLLDFDPMDPAQYQVSDDERKRIMLTNLLLSAGAGLGGARKGQELGGLTYGLANGGMMAQQALSDAQRAKWDKLKGAGAAMEFAGKKQAYNDDQAERQVLQNFQPPQSQGLSDMSPTPQNAAALGAQQPKPSMYDQLNALADQMQANKLPKKAEAYREMAMKYAPKYSTTPQVGMDAQGNPYNFVLDESGNEKRLGAGVKPDIHPTDLGGKVTFNDYLRMKPGTEMGKTATPGELMSNELGRANYGLSAAHLKLAQDKANAEKTEQFGTPIQITGGDGETQMMAPRKGTNQMVAMTDEQGRPVTKSASIPQAYKDKAYGLSNLRDAVTEYQKSIKDLKPGDYFSPTKMAEVQAQYGRTQMGLKNLFELGVIAGPDMQILAQNLTDPTSFRGMGGKMYGTLEAQNKVLFSMLDSADKNLASAYNQRPRNQKPGGNEASNMSDAELRKALGL